MCGIYGMVSLSGCPLRNAVQLDGMRRDLVHRGPDGHGRIGLPHAALGVNRLRIVDRSAAADQPFTDPTGRVWLALNGEIYNAVDLRRCHGSYPYRSRSDAEPVLAAYLERGADAIEDLDGMFAIAIWDERARTLILARDRAGEKPLFYSLEDNELWFASEIQPLLRRPGRRALDRGAFAESVRWGYIMEPRTPWCGIKRVPAGSLFISSASPQVRRYWNPATIQPGPLAGAPARLAELLDRAVGQQLAADVPVGVFTSGGLDSSLLVALAASRSSTPLHTFTVRFPEPRWDESPFAAAVARRFGARHTTVTADDVALRRGLESVTTRVAEPIADPAVLPTALLAETAREHVGVVLSGEGADELFGGYPTYLGHRLARWWARTPALIRQGLAAALDLMPQSPGRVPVDFLLRRFVAAAALPWRQRHIAWFGTALPDEVLSPELREEPTSGGGPCEPDDVLRSAMVLDYSTYLRDNLLVKIDRATMLHSLEARAPYLDRAVTAFAFSLPPATRTRWASSKQVLREAGRGRLPRATLRRRKRGLSLPIARLLNGPLAPEADRLLEPGRLSRQGLLNAALTTQLLAEHRAGRFTLSRGLWTLFTWQRWLDHWIPEGSE